MDHLGAPQRLVWETPSYDKASVCALGCVACWECSVPVISRPPVLLTANAPKVQGSPTPLYWDSIRERQCRASVLRDWGRDCRLSFICKCTNRLLYSASGGVQIIKGHVTPLPFELWPFQRQRSSAAPHRRDAGITDWWILSSSTGSATVCKNKK